MSLPFCFSDSTLFHVFVHFQVHCRAARAENSNHTVQTQPLSPFMIQKCTTETTISSHRLTSDLEERKPSASAASQRLRVSVSSVSLLVFHSSQVNCKDLFDFALFCFIQLGGGQRAERGNLVIPTEEVSRSRPNTRTRTPRGGPGPRRSWTSAGRGAHCGVSAAAPRGTSW